MNLKTGTDTDRKLLVYVVNVDWYFLLHWKERAIASVQNGYDVHVVTNFLDDGNRHALEEFGITTHQVHINRSSLNPFGEIFTFFKILKLLRSIKPDLVHSITIKPNIYLGAAKRFIGFPLVATVPGMGLIYSSNSAYYRLLRKVVNCSYALVFKQRQTRVTFENQHDLDYLTTKIGLKQRNAIKINGAGVNLEKFKMLDELATDTLNIFFAARLIKSKGIEDLVVAVKNLRHHSLKINLSVAGIIDTDAKDRVDLELLERWHSNGDIIWLGQRDDIPDLISHSNIVALPTHYSEGIPRILIEASACGRAIITTDVAGCNEFVDHMKTGLVVQPNNVTMLEDAIRLLADDSKLRKTMGENGRRKVSGNYTTSHVVEHTLSIYRSFDLSKNRTQTV